MLTCAIKVLGDVRDGVAPALSDPCYASSSNPGGQRPPLTGASGASVVVLTSLIASLQNGLGDLYDTDPSNNATSPSLYEGLDQLVTALTSQDPAHPGAIPALSQIECGLDSTSLGATCGLLRPGKDGLRQGLAQVSAGVPQLVNTIVATVQGAIGNTSDAPSDKTLRGGINGLIDGVGQLSSGGSDLVAGLGLLANGSGDLTDGTGQLSDGLAQLDGGAGKLAEGTGTAADGSGQLAAGADTLSSGLQDAANGSGKIADGLATAAGGAPKLRDGAQQLSDQGTKKLIEAGKSTAQNYGELYAVMKAGADRANTEDMAFGAPADASGLTAYNYIINGDDGEGGRNVARGLAGLAVLGAGGGVFALRRRFI